MNQQIKKKTKIALDALEIYIYSNQSPQEKRVDNKTSLYISHPQNVGNRPRIRTQFFPVDVPLQGYGNLCYLLICS